MSEWYNELGFEKNPFSIKPGADIIGYDGLLKEIKKNLLKGAVYLVTGDYGVGKTSLLWNIIRDFGGRRKIIFYSYNRRSKAISIEKLLFQRGLIHRMFHIKPRGMMLLLDEAEGLKADEQEAIISHCRNGFIKSAVIVVRRKEDISFCPEFESLIGKNHIRIGVLRGSDAVRLVKKRLKENSFLDESLMLEIYHLSPNPRIFLENCEDVCRFAFLKGAEKAGREHLSAIRRDDDASYGKSRVR